MVAAEGILRARVHAREAGTAVFFFMIQPPKASSISQLHYVAQGCQRPRQAQGREQLLLSKAAVTNGRNLSGFNIN